MGMTTVSRRSRTPYDALQGGGTASGILSRRTFLRALGIAAGVAATSSWWQLGPGSGVARAATGWSRYRTDPHLNCVISGDAVDDLARMHRRVSDMTRDR